MKQPSATVPPSMWLELEINALCTNIRSHADYLELHLAAWKEGRTDRTRLCEALARELMQLQHELNDDTVRELKELLAKVPERSPSAKLDEFFRELCAP